MSPPEKVVVAELNLEKSVAAKQPADDAEATVQSMVRLPPNTLRPAVAVIPLVPETVPVATEPSFAGNPLVVVQYEIYPAVSFVEVEIELTYEFRSVCRGIT